MKPNAKQAGVRFAPPVVGSAFLGLATLFSLGARGQWDPAQTFLALITIGAALAMVAFQERRARPVLMASLAVSSMVQLSALILHGGVTPAGLLLANVALLLALALPLPWRFSIPASARTQTAEAQPTRPLTSLVLLLTRPRFLDEASLQQTAGDAWGGNYADEITRLNASTIQVRSHHGVFHVHQLPAPYWPDLPTVAQAVADSVRRHAILTHRAWIGVDLVESGADVEAGASLYAPVIRFIVELADPEDTLAIFRPETGQINVWNDEVFRLLVGPGGLDRFSRDTTSQTYRVGEENAVIEEAIRKARLRFPEFRAAFRHQRAGDLFTVKALVTENGKAECIWLHVSSIHQDIVDGTLANHPIDLPSLRFGSAVTVSAAELHDWAYRLGEDPEGPVIGLFTVSSIRAAGLRTGFPFRDAP
jgi:uncharacterized protein YegJ (DUF2314 family)